MATNYTSSLRLALPTTGELTGTWGTTVNTGITQLLETAVAGYVSVAMTDANYTLTTANGATDEARNMFVSMTGTLTATRNVVCPTQEKLYFFRNSTTGGFAITLKTSGGTGISVPNGKTAILFCDGTNVISAFDHIPATTLATALAATSGGTGQSSYTTGDLPYASSSTAISKLAIGSTGQVLQVTGGVPAWGNVGVAGGGTGVTSYTSGDMLYATGATTLSKLAIGTAGQAIVVTAGAPAWGVLGVAGGGTGVTSYTAGDMTYATGATTVAKLAIGASTRILGSTGTAPQWEATTGTGAPVRSTSPAITTPAISGNATFDSTIQVQGISYLYGGMTFGDNVMSSYKEGTWTPSFTLGSGSVTYSVQAGYYTRVGNVVTATATITLASRSSPNGTVDIGGLPFTPNASMTFTAFVSADSINAYTSLHILVTSSTARLYTISTGGTRSTAVGNFLSNNASTVSFTLVYLV